MMGRLVGDQARLFHSFNLEDRVPASHLARRAEPRTFSAISARSRPRLKIKPASSGSLSSKPRERTLGVICGGLPAFGSSRRPDHYRSSQWRILRRLMRMP